jgi:hypothetical protein
MTIPISHCRDKDQIDVDFVLGRTPGLVVGIAVKGAATRTRSSTLANPVRGDRGLWRRRQLPSAPPACRRRRMQLWRLGKPLEAVANSGTRRRQVRDVSRPNPEWGASTSTRLAHIAKRRKPAPVPKKAAPPFGSKLVAERFSRRFGKSAKCLKTLARPERFELPTPRFVVWCSIQLSYGREGGVHSDKVGRLQGGR